jgi:hypothetical protein
MDKYEKAHLKAIKEIKSCSKRKNNSCWKCDEFFECDIRADYVKKTYESMSKGNIGGFEF